MPDEPICPTCGQRAVYVPELDRYVHADGSDNRPCWRAITRGRSDTHGDSWAGGGELRQASTISAL